MADKVDRSQRRLANLTQNQLNNMFLKSTFDANLAAGVEADENLSIYLKSLDSNRQRRALSDAQASDLRDKLIEGSVRVDADLTAGLQALYVKVQQDEENNADRYKQAGLLMSGRSDQDGHHLDETRVAGDFHLKRQYQSNMHSLRLHDAWLTKSKVDRTANERSSHQADLSERADSFLLKINESSWIEY